MPVKPSNNIMGILFSISLGRCPSILMVKKMRKTEAIENLIKAAE